MIVILSKISLNILAWEKNSDFNNISNAMLQFSNHSRSVYYIYIYMYMYIEKLQEADAFGS